MSTALDPTTWHSSAKRSGTCQKSVKTRFGSVVHAGAVACPSKPQAEWGGAAGGRR